MSTASSKPPSAKAKPTTTNEVSDHKLIVCFGQNRFDKNPKPVTVTMTELAERFSKPKPRGRLSLAAYLALDKNIPTEVKIRTNQKDGEYFIPATFTHAGTRDAKDVAAMSGFSGDIDTEAVSRAELEARLAGLQFVAYSSYSHQSSAPRWRFFVPYALPSTEAQHKKVYAYFQHQFGEQLDTRCETTNQIWYTPACPHDAVNLFEFFVGQGALLDADSIPTLAAATQSKSTAAATTSFTGASLAELMNRVCRDGERTDHVWRLGGALIASGLGLGQTIAQCKIWNSGNIDKWPDDKIESTCMAIWARDTHKHPERHLAEAANEPLFDLSAGRIDRFLASPPPPRRWLLEGLIVVGKAGAVVAPGGFSKSQWLLQLGVSVATSIDLAGHWKAGETGGVLVLCAEDDYEEIHRRIHTIQQRLQAEGHGAALAALPDRLFIFSTIGVDTLFTKAGMNGSVAQTATLHRVVALAKQVTNLKLIVIDPVSRFRGGEENSNEDATRFVEALENIAKLTGATVLAAHHSNKASYSADANQGASRGASALTDGLRWQMNLNPPTDKQAEGIGVTRTEMRKFVVATVTKSNYSAIPEPVILERQAGGYLQAVTASQAQTAVQFSSVLRVLDLISKASKPMTARHLEVEHGGVHNASGLAKQRLREVLKFAAEKGWLDGGDRKPLALSTAGAEFLRQMPPNESNSSAKGRAKG